MTTLAKRFENKLVALRERVASLRTDDAIRVESLALDAREKQLRAQLIEARSEMGKLASLRLRLVRESASYVAARAELDWLEKEEASSKKVRVEIAEGSQFTDALCVGSVAGGTELALDTSGETSVEQAESQAAVGAADEVRSEVRDDESVDA